MKPFRRPFARFRKHVKRWMNLPETQPGPIAKLRNRLRLKRRINALAGREIFPVERQPWAREEESAVK